ncbi:MAG: SDR family oxidoreductase [Planctomycetota bacterium]
MDRARLPAGARAHRPARRRRRGLALLHRLDRGPLRRARARRLRDQQGGPLRARAHAEERGRLGRPPRARVNLVEPGWTVTEMVRAELDDDSHLERVGSTMPLQQLARAQDIAQTMVYLSSPRLARHVTGQTITVAGGMEGRLLWQPGEIDPAAIRARLERD